MPVRIFFRTAQSFPICFGKRLYISMVCDDHTSMTQIEYVIHNFTDITYTIHFTHECMTMPFNSLTLCSISDLPFFQHFNLLYRHDKIPFIVVIFNATIDAHITASLVLMHHFSCRASAFKTFDLDGICAIIDGHGLNQHTLFGFDFFHCEDFTFDLNIADRLIYFRKLYLCVIFHLCTVIALTCRFLLWCGDFLLDRCLHDDIFDFSLLCLFDDTGKT